MADNTVPFALLKKSFLATIDKKIYATAVPARPANHRERVSFLRSLLAKSDEQPEVEPRYRPVRQMQLSIAGWVTLPEEIRSAISLLLVYEDSDGLQAIVVDEMNARGASQIMLSGQVEINAKNAIDSLSLYCGGIEDERVWVEDLHVRRIDSTVDPLVSLAS